MLAEHLQIQWFRQVSHDRKLHGADGRVDRRVSGDQDDGLTISVPKEGLQQLDARRLEWLVPGRVEEKLWLILAPGFAIFFVVSVFNLVGEGLRDALDPKLRE